MPLTQEQMAKLKRANISKDTEKTNERIKENFLTASAIQKRVIAKVAGQGLSSFYNMYSSWTVRRRGTTYLLSLSNTSLT